MAQVQHRARFYDLAWLEDGSDNAALKLAAPVTVTVYEGGTTTPIPASKLFTTPTGSTTIATNPFTSATGIVEFWLDEEADLNIKYDGASVPPPKGPLGVKTAEYVPVRRIRTPFGYDVSDWNVGLPPLIETATFDAGITATNKTRAQNLYAMIAALGGGDMIFRGNALGKYWWLPQNTKLDTGGVAATVNIVGEGSRISRLMLAGDTGPFIEMQTTSSVLNWRPFVKDLSIHHNTNTMTGPDFLIGQWCAYPMFQNVEWYNDFTATDVLWPAGHPSAGQKMGENYTSTNGAQTCVESKNGLWIDHCLMSTRVTGSTKTIVLSNTSAQYELVIRGRSHLSTAPAVISVNPSPPYDVTRSGGGMWLDIQTVHPGAVDLISASDECLFSGGNPGLNNQSNAIIYQVQVNGCQLDVANQHYRSIPNTTGNALAGVRTAQFRNCWVHADTVGFEASGGGLQKEIVIERCESNGAYTHFFNCANVGLMRVAGCQIQHNANEIASPAAAVALKASGIGNVEFVDNFIDGQQANARALVEVTTSTVYTANVTNNDLVLPAGIVRGVIAPNARFPYRRFGPNNIRTTDPVVADGDRGSYAAQVDTARNASINWSPAWHDVGDSRSLESHPGRLLSHTHAVNVNDRQYQVGGLDACGVVFTGSQYITTPDTADLSYPSGGMSGFVIASPADIGTARVFWGKNNGSSAAEYLFGIDPTDKLFLILYDNTTTNFIQAISASAVTFGRFRMWGFTYDGSAGAGGIVLYQDYAVFPQGTPASGGSFGALKNTTAQFEIGGTNGTLLFQGILAHVFQRPGVATANDIAAWKHASNARFELGQ